MTPRALIAFAFLASGSGVAFGQQYGYAPQYGSGYDYPPDPQGVGGNREMSYGAPGYGNYAPPPPQSGSSFGGAQSSFGPNLINYGYLKADYIHTSMKEDGLNGSNGIGVKLSVELFKPLFLTGGFDWGSSGGGSGGDSGDGYDFNTFHLGGGLYLPIHQRFHLFGEVGGLYSKLDAADDTLSFDDVALYVRPGLRFAATEAFEVQAGLMVTSADNYDAMVFDVGAYFRVFSQFDLGLGADFGDNSTSFRGGVRLRW